MVANGKWRDYILVAAFIGALGAGGKDVIGPRYVTEREMDQRMTETQRQISEMRHEIETLKGKARPGTWP